MSLQVPDPPEQGMSIIREALSSAMKQPNMAASVLAEAAADSLTTAAPHKVYFVGLSDLAEGRLLYAAQLKGWRYLIFEHDKPAVAAELKTNTADELSFSNVNRGPFVASTVDGVNFAESLEIVQNEDFELRVLEVSSLYFVSLWLHGEKDLLVPLDPTPEELEPLTVYHEDEIIERLRGPAQNRLKFDNSPRP